MKRMYVLLLVCVLLSNILLAELPTLDKEQLANLIQKQENRVQAFKVRYKLESGIKYKESGERTHGFFIDCEQAYDVNSGCEYFHEIWLDRSDGEGHEEKLAYDGETGTKLTLKQPGDTRFMWGRILPDMPDDLKNQAYWKPDFLGGYGLLRRYGYNSLAKAIKNSEKVEVSTDILDGEEVYKISFAIQGEQREFTDREGKTRTYYPQNNFYSYISPERNYLPLKIEKVSNNKEMISTCIASDFREVESEVWLPFEIEWLTSGGSSRIIDVNSISINKDVSFSSKLKFPPKTYVNDEIKGIKYQVDLSGGIKKGSIKEVKNKATD